MTLPPRPHPCVAISKLNAIICCTNNIAHTSAPRAAGSMPQLHAAAGLYLCMQRCVQTVTSAPGTPGFFHLLRYSLRCPASLRHVNTLS